jgi:hypothetical protein
MRGSRRSASNTSTHTAFAPRRRRSANSRAGRSVRGDHGRVASARALSQPGTPLPWSGTVPARAVTVPSTGAGPVPTAGADRPGGWNRPGSRARAAPTGVGMLTGSRSKSSSSPGLGVTEACSTALVTTSETSRQPSAICSESMPQDRKVCAVSRLASETMIGSAGNTFSVEASCVGEDLTTRMAMSSSMSPGTANSAAVATASASPLAAAARTACSSISTASVSEYCPEPSARARRSVRPSV